MSAKTVFYVMPKVQHARVNHAFQAAKTSNFTFSMWKVVPNIMLMNVIKNNNLNHFVSVSMC